LSKLNNISKDEFQERENGRIEWVCEHGVGHTIWSPNDDHIHGCDGCCLNLKK